MTAHFILFFFFDEEEMFSNSLVPAITFYSFTASSIIHSKFRKYSLEDSCRNKNVRIRGLND